MDFAQVERTHVERAIADLAAGSSPAGFRDSTTYDVIHQGRPYPPKQLIALAFKHATGKVVTGDDFGGGVARTGSGRTFGALNQKPTNKREIWFRLRVGTA